jgi:hypothetical protein
MPMTCEADLMMGRLYSELLKLRREKPLTKQEDLRLRSLLEQYWAIKCPEDNPCRPKTCGLAAPNELADEYGYRSLSHLLRYLKFRDGQPLVLEEKPGVTRKDRTEAVRKLSR